jgi:aldose 1-epimerase
MVTLTGEQFEIRAGGYRAVVTESGAALRLLEHAGRPLVDGFAEDEMPSGGRGQLLMPWPNRIQDGRYEFDGSTYQLGLTDPTRHHASHGLARWVAWTLEEHTDVSVSLVYRLMAQTGYPWTLDLHVVYDLSADGLTVTQTATNLASSPAPYASGAHPYLLAGPGPVDDWELTLPAATRAVTDERLIPTGTEPVEGTGFDFRVARPVRGTVFNDSFTDLDRDEDERVTVLVRHPAAGTAVVLWADAMHPWLLVYTADDTSAPRRSLAVEPMTAPVNAFRTGADLVTLTPAGTSGDELSVTWGIRAVD